MSLPTPDERAAALVQARPRTPGGPWFVQLRELAEPPVLLGPYQNPSVAAEDAGKIRKFLAVVIAEARRAGPA